MEETDFQRFYVFLHASALFLSRPSLLCLCMYFFCLCRRIFSCLRLSSLCTSLSFVPLFVDGLFFVSSCLCSRLLVIRAFVCWSCLFDLTFAILLMYLSHPCHYQSIYLVSISQRSRNGAQPRRGLFFSTLTLPKL